METGYLQDPSQCGNVLKGFEGFLSSSKSSTLYGHELFLFVCQLYPFPLLMFIHEAIFLVNFDHLVSTVYR